jgi:hypothetical protein
MQRPPSLRGGGRCAVRTISSSHACRSLSPSGRSPHARTGQGIAGWAIGKETHP